MCCFTIPSATGLTFARNGYLSTQVTTHYHSTQTPGYKLASEQVYFILCEILNLLQLFMVYLKCDAVVGLREIYIALARFI